MALGNILAGMTVAEDLVREAVGLARGPTDGASAAAAAVAAAVARAHGTEKDEASAVWQNRAAQ